MTLNNAISKSRTVGVIRLVMGRWMIVNIRPETGRASKKIRFFYG
jgi:hypothetical protein